VGEAKLRNGAVAVVVPVGCENYGGRITGEEKTSNPQAPKEQWVKENKGWAPTAVAVGPT